MINRLRKPDVVTRDCGSIVNFSLHSKRAGVWWADNVGSENAVAESRYAINIMEGMLSDGLILKDAVSGRFARLAVAS